MKNIVLVDDYVNYAEVLKDFIESSKNAECTAFSEPLKALEHVKNDGNIDIVITDYEMPRMNGFELASKLLELFPALRIVVCSGHDKRTLESIRNKYNMEEKVEITSKGDMDFMLNLTK